MTEQGSYRIGAELDAKIKLAMQSVGLGLRLESE
jgi:hypothetical protein